MNRTNIYAAFVLIAASLAISAAGQSSPSARVSATGQTCQMAGAFRIDVAASDRLYSVVSGATSSVPFSEQQRFFMDLSLRLTPPDMLAIECSGNRVSVGSSRSAKVTFLADGRARRERSSRGGIINSRVELDRDTLNFTSTGDAKDNVDVTFQAINNGERIRVTRKIYAEQLTEPIVIRTVYERVSDTVNWNTLGDALIAKRSARPENGSPATGSSETRDRAEAAGNSQATELRAALDSWIAATNRRDLDSQMRYYLPELKAFYLARNTNRSTVRTEKIRVIQSARSVDIRAEEPEIVFQDGGRTAVMRFRKKYSVADRNRTRSGEVVQELRWQQTDGGWRIYSERDVRVIR